jgi:NTE family protein
MKLCRFAVCLLLLSNLWAQNPRAQGGSAVPREPERTGQVRQRPRIGLVLEGGGALGLAHAGVIRWLEENRIPVDMIAGTSMGGLIGGIYASGESPEQIRTLIRNIQWSRVLGGITPYRNLAFRRKQDQQEYQNAFEFGLKEGTQFPSGFNSGQQVGLILDWVGLPYSEMKSFDELPIPFRCVATDLVSGQKHLFDGGSLAEAMRATISLPAIFVPVRDGSHVLVDGGLLDNLPVDLARQMGADIVIAVHLRTQPLDPRQALTTDSVLARSASVSVAANELASIASLEKADILLTADLAKFDTTDYTLFDQIEAEGYKAAQNKSALLSRLQADESEWQQILSTRAGKRRQAPVPQFVEVTGGERGRTAWIATRGCASGRRSDQSQGP